MKGETEERWRELCAKAATEQDPNRLMELISEINELIEKKQQRLVQQQDKQQGLVWPAQPGVLP
jgi:hypothetical protein